MAEGRGEIDSGLVLLCFFILLGDGAGYGMKWESTSPSREPESEGNRPEKWATKDGWLD